MHLRSKVGKSCLQGFHAQPEGLDTGEVKGRFDFAMIDKCLTTILEKA